MILWYTYIRIMDKFSQKYCILLPNGCPVVSPGVHDRDLAGVLCLGDAAVGRVVTSSSTLGQDEVGGVDLSNHFIDRIHSWINCLLKDHHGHHLHFYFYFPKYLTILFRARGMLLNDDILRRFYLLLQSTASCKNIFH